jgi:para-nitrobenzyl esterase
MFSDGALLPAKPLAIALEEGPTHAVPVMLGTNRDEERLFLYANPEYVDQWFGVYPRVLDEERCDRDATLTSRIWKAVGADEPAAALSRRQPGEVYAYRFDWDEEPTVLGTDLGWLLGASHGFEIPFVFGHWDLGPAGDFLFDEENQAGREELSKAMQGYWATFAREGDPGTGGQDGLRWGAWDEAGDRYIVFDTAAGGGRRMARETISVDGVAGELLTDARFPTDQERCTGFATLHDRAPERFDRAAYDQAADGLCAELEPEQLLAGE